jgi:hypothetical protein
MPTDSAKAREHLKRSLLDSFKVVTHRYSRLILSGGSRNRGDEASDFRAPELTRLETAVVEGLSRV